MPGGGGVMVTVATSMGCRCGMALCTGQEVPGQGPTGDPCRPLPGPGQSRGQRGSELGPEELLSGPGGQGAAAGTVTRCWLRADQASA